MCDQALGSQVIRMLIAMTQRHKRQRGTPRTHKRRKPTHGCKVSAEARPVLWSSLRPNEPALVSFSFPFSHYDPLPLPFLYQSSTCAPMQPLWPPWRREARDNRKKKSDPSFVLSFACSVPLGLSRSTLGRSHALCSLHSLLSLRCLGLLLAFAQPHSFLLSAAVCSCPAMVPPLAARS